MIKTGLQLLLDENLAKIKKTRLGIVVNQTSVDSNLRHAINIFHEHKDIKLTALFGPQHGIRGETQDNMIEWEGFVDPYTKLPVYSLYGKTRQPTSEMLKDVDTLIFDIQDIGSKYYTFIYTMSYVMQSCAKYKKKFIVLDRPNPITGKFVEGCVTQRDYTSFVGLHPIVIRHGMTIGELALLFNKEFNINCDLEVIKMVGWKRDMWFEETGLHWVMPSPNMPTLNTAIVYPGMCLIEGTTLSEGRGTTKPFELFGAPYIDPFALIKRLEAENLDGVIFRPAYFLPTFQKWFGKLCGGLQIHITDRNKYKSVLTAVAVIKCINELYPKQFKWKEPPYEYEYKNLPFDTLAGNSKLRTLIEKGASLQEIELSWQKEQDEFKKIREKYLLY